MLTVKTIVEPDANVWKAVIKGMRLPFKSGERGDSDYCYGDTCYAWHSDDLCLKCPYYEKANINPNDSDDYDEYCHYNMGDGFPTYVLGKNDLNLFMKLCTEGDPSHRKLLRQLPVIMEINAPLYWHKQMDTYKVATVANSESTMHCLTKEPFKLEDFSFDTHNPEAFPLFININVFDNTDVGCGYEFMDDEFITSAFANDNLKMEIFEYEILTIKVLNCLRKLYLETGDKSYWNYINELLPQSYYQTRLWSGNYETCVSIIKNRIDHDLDEWRQLIIEMLSGLHMLYPIVEALGIVRTEGDNVEYWSTRDKREGQWVTLCNRKDIAACEQFAYPDSEVNNG